MVRSASVAKFFCDKVWVRSKIRSASRRSAAIAPTGARAFDVTIHEEGTGLTYRQEVTLTASTETRLLALVADLHRWSVGLGLTEAVGAAKTYVTAALAAANRIKIGSGHGPTHHFHAWW